MEFGTLVQHRQYQRKYLAVAEARTIYQIIEAMACLYLGCRRSLSAWVLIERDRD